MPAQQWQSNRPQLILTPTRPPCCAFAGLDRAEGRSAPARWARLREGREMRRRKSSLAVPLAVHFCAKAGAYGRLANYCLCNLRCRRPFAQGDREDGILAPTAVSNVAQ